MSYDPYQTPPARPVHPPQQYGSPIPYGQPYPVPPVIVTPGVPTSGWGTAALVLGIVGALGGWCMLGLPCVVAVIAGHVGLNETRDGQKGGRGLAVAGLILGYLFVVPWVLLFFLGGAGAALTAVTPGSTPTP